MLGGLAFYSECRNPQYAGSGASILMSRILHAPLNSEWSS